MRAERNRLRYATSAISRDIDFVCVMVCERCVIRQYDAEVVGDGEKVADT
jgi:hypothetical protein